MSVGLSPELFSRWLRPTAGLRDNAVSPDPSKYCDALMIHKPTPQPCWGARELARRRQSSVIKADEKKVNLRNVVLEKELAYVATNKNGEYIFPSEGGQDRWLYLNHFRHLTRPIIYADFGANDPIFTSNTFFFDHCLRAEGICVEANPQFTDRYKRHRSCKLINTCLSNKAEEVSFIFQMKDFSTRSGVLRTNKSYKNGLNKDTKEVGMTCTTGQTLFEENGMKHVDWLDLDAEGHELYVLQGIDFTATEIDIITVEANDASVHQFLIEKGYRKAGRLHYDLVFVRNGFDFAGEDYNFEHTCE